MNILVTGGTGFVGSHTVVKLVESGHFVIVIDDLSNSSAESLSRVEQITGKQILFYRMDIRDRAGLNKVFSLYNFDCCIHFAAVKDINESIRCPSNYYDINVNGSITLIDVMRKHNCKNLIFSSSAAVYGTAARSPIKEDYPYGEHLSPYGKTKVIAEEFFSDLCIADQENKDSHPWSIIALRYFNPIGAHSSGLLGESPLNRPNNLMPAITQVASGKKEILHIYGGNYDTHDGTGIRDYIHVMDLAEGHMCALEIIKEQSGFKAFNLGTGVGYSVLDVVYAFEKANGIKIPYVIEEKRQCDSAVCYADPSQAFRIMGWKATLGLEDMCRDSWNWQKINPNGYDSIHNR